MSTRRFYCDQLDDGQIVEMQGEEARHLSRVLRAKVGDSVELFDGCGHSARGVVEQLGRTSASVIVDRVSNVSGRGRVAVTAIVALPRGGAADDVVRHLVECGVAAFREVAATRSVRRAKRRNASENEERFKRLSLSAMKQCGLNIMPQLLPTISVSDLQLPLKSLGVFGTTSPDALTLQEVMDGLEQAPDSVDFVIGPEGGWTPEEGASLLEAGFTPVSLGTTTLRIETAAIAMATFLAALR